MNYRPFGKTDLMVSEIGFGAWAIGGGAKVGNVPIGWGETDDNISEKAIYAALDKGINFFDTADFYGLGHSEKLLGNVLKNTPGVILATKVGHRNINQTIVLDYSREYILKACEQSLVRLKRDVIDYYQLHSARLSHLQSGECIEAMELLSQEGKIKFWGLSLNTFNPVPEAEFMINKKVGHGFQLVLNLINQRAYPVLKNAAANGYGIIARMPLQFGLLTGKLTAATKFSESDHRRFRLTSGIVNQALQILNEKVWPIADKKRMDKTALALSFILSVPQVSTVIPGIRTPDHVFQNTTGIKQLEDDDFNWLLQLANEEWKPVLELMEMQG